MQILGVLLLVAVVWFGLGERGATTVTAFDLHAFVMVLGGSLAAILVSSSTRTTARTLGCMRELLPGLGTLGRGTDELEAQREELVSLWRAGKRAQAVALAEDSRHSAIGRMVSLVLERAPDEATRAAFTELNHATMTRWQPAVSNWEVLAKLAPSFGMVGTITGMIQLFQNMGSDTF
jgi:chemotaxis protein MotA